MHPASAPTNMVSTARSCSAGCSSIATWRSSAASSVRRAGKGTESAWRSVSAIMAMRLRVRPAFLPPLQCGPWLTSPAQLTSDEREG